MTQIEALKEHRCFGGVQGYYAHASTAIGLNMRVAVYVPPQVLTGGTAPVFTFLSGLTCTEENFVTKSGVQRAAAELGFVVVAPDTSPRGAGVDGEDQDDDLGTGAGFYVDATEAPWSRHYQMYSYITSELPAWLGAHFPVDLGRHALCGHSMGGHGALVLGLRNPDRFQSVSALAPIAAPSQCPWGHKALGAYLGSDSVAWADYDATRLVEKGHRVGPLKIDQGEADPFLETQLKPELLVAACQAASQELRYESHAHYDHSYFFVQSFIEDHLRFHAACLS